MAASFSRPDPSSPASIAEANFNTGRRGYSTDEVRAFLRAVSAELARLQERERQLEAELSLARSQPPQVADLDDAEMTRIVGDETVRVLQTARESASLIRIRAEENASRLVSEANDEVNRMRQEIDLEVSRKRKDALSDAEAEVAMAKQQGREMVNEARSYRERVLSDLDRRTKLARQQIEELAHGRDRLLQVFERARLVAVDVTSELQELDGPSELVNLAATTGPVPLMVPRQRPASTVAADDDPTDVLTIDVRDVDLGDVDPGDVDPGDVDPGDVDPGDVDVVGSVNVSDDDDTLVAEFPDTVNLVLAASEDDEQPGDDDSDGDDGARDAGARPVADGEPADVVPFDGRAGDDHAGDGDTADDSLDDDSPAIDGSESVDGLADGAGPSVAATRHDGNVVNLFRGREADPSADVDSHGDGDGDDDDRHAGVAEQGAEVGVADRPDVGGIFERLRHAQDTLTADADVTTDGAVTTQAAVPSEAGEPTEAAETTEAAVAATPFTRRDEAIVPLIVAAARKLKRVLADEQNGVLDALRSNEPVTSIDAFLPALDEHTAAYVGALDDDMIVAAAAGAGEVGVADTAALHKTLRKSGATTGAHDLVRTSLVESLRHRLERCVSDGAGDNTDITRRVRAVYREWKTQHIDDQLDDVFRFAYSGGLTAMIEPGTAVAWSLDPAKAACADCEDNSLSGAVVIGSEFPTGHRSAPAHPGCRCLTLPASQ